MTTASTSLAQLRYNTAPVPVSSGELSIYSEAGSKLMWNMAKAYSASTITPKDYRGQESNCFIALDMARRLDINPLTVMQQLYVISGRPTWSAQFLIGMFNNNPHFTPLRFRFEGKPGTDDWGCRAYAVEKATEEELEGTLVTIGIAKAEGWYNKDGSKWKTMPEQMLRYRAAAWFIRSYAPEQGMGLMTREEIIDMDKDEDGIYKISTADIKSGGSFIEADPEPSVEEVRPAAKEKAKPKPETKGTESVSPSEMGKKVSGPIQATPEGDDITPGTLQAIEIELTRLGAPGQLPPEIANEYETGDPSELTESQGQQALIYLQGIKD